MKTAQRLGNLGTETSFRVAQDAAEWKSRGNQVYPFHLGDLNFPMAPHIVEAEVFKSSGTKVSEATVKLLALRPSSSVH